MKLSLRLGALSDLREACDWYQAQRSGLGEEFLTAVDETLAKITANPKRFAVLVLDVRQALIRRFPYRVLYRLIGTEIVVVGCFHARRDPRRWRERR